MERLRDVTRDVIRAAGAAALAFLLGFAATSVAEEHSRFARHFGGMAKNFYLGLEGVQNFTFVDYEQRDTFDYNRRGFDSQCANCFRRDIGENGWGGRFALGYGKFFRDRWHLGLELNATKSNNELNSYSKSGNGRALEASLEHEHSYQAVLRPGLKVNDDAAAFLRLGAERGKFRIRHEEEGDEPGDGQDNKVSYSDNRWENAWVVGFDHEVRSKDKRLGFRLGWEYADYGNMGASLDWVGHSRHHGRDDWVDRYPGIRDWDTAVVTIKAGFVWHPWAEGHGDESASAYHDFGGFYGGLKGGYSAMEEGFREEDKARHMAMQDPSVGVTLGWGRQFRERYYAGLDLNYAPGLNAESERRAIEGGVDTERIGGRNVRKEVAWIYQRKQESKYEADASLRLGYLIAPKSMVYAKAGYAISKWKVTSKPTERWYTKDGVPDEFKEYTSEGGSQSKRMKGPKSGWGLTALSKTSGSSAASGAMPATARKGFSARKP